MMSPSCSMMPQPPSASRTGSSKVFIDSVSQEKNNDERGHRYHAAVTHTGDGGDRLLAGDDVHAQQREADEHRQGVRGGEAHDDPCRIAEPLQRKASSF